MLQRIQTIWMLLAVLGSIFLFITGQDYRISEESNIPLIQYICPVLFFLGTLSIVSFKNRKRQILLNNFSIIINVLLIGVLGYWLLTLSGGINFPEKGIEPIFPIISTISLLIANVFIKKDERLVKSVDRLR